MEFGKTSAGFQREFAAFLTEGFRMLGYLLDPLYYVDNTTGNKQTKPQRDMGLNPTTRRIGANTSQQGDESAVLPLVQMLCMRHRITTGGYDQQGSQRTQGIAQSNLQRIGVHCECRTYGSYPLTPTRSPIPGVSITPPAVAQPMNCGS
ncbi:hypothetical protein F511_42904 [Dorcoceras hygrometricum]|uniref:Uncharacterized protein n=1 Tax=Dorcoceras hygrometricum TaxID=472368 RepID=A0A2Z7BIC3_9LAMI|nr:hypothetical protein F511_42904 [Dorcoceras hygrometricum]